MTETYYCARLCSSGRLLNILRCFDNGAANLSKVCEIGKAGPNVLGLLQYSGVDDHDVGELCCEAQLHLHATVKLQVTVLWKNWTELDTAGYVLRWSLTSKSSGCGQ
jgi:hypothetical protein